MSSSASDCVSDICMDESILNSEFNFVEFYAVNKNYPEVLSFSYSTSNTINDEI